MKKNYITLSIREALVADNGTPMRLTGTITSAHTSTNTKGKTQYWATLSDGTSKIDVTVFDADLDRCRLIEANGAYVEITGKWSTNKRHVVFADEIRETSSGSHLKPVIASTPTDRFTEAELLFLRTQKIPHDMYLVDHVRIGGRELDFVLYRKSDGVAMCAFEIDGNTHRESRIADVVRDAELVALLGCQIFRITAATIYEDARKAGLIQ